MVSDSEAERRSEARTVIAVDLDYFYAQAEEIRDPSLVGKPVVVCVFSGRTEDSGAVSTSNYAARSLGVRSGMPIRLAKRILEHHPEAVLVPMDHEYYESVSERVMQILRGHAKKLEQASIDEAYLDATEETGGDFVRAEELGRRVKIDILREEKLTSTVGIGPNKLVAKMAVDHAKPDGFTVVPPEKIRPFLDPLPVGKLFGIGPKTEARLMEMGISTVRDLSEVDESLLAREFGKKLGPELRRSARGIDDSPVEERGVEQMSRIITLKKDASTFDFREALIPLVKDISGRLRSMRLSARNVGVIGITTELKTKNRSSTLTRPTDEEEEILRISSNLFRELFDDSRRSTLRRVGIRVSGLEPRTWPKGSKGATLTDYI